MAEQQTTEADGQPQTGGPSGPLDPVVRAFRLVTYGCGTAFDAQAWEPIRNRDFCKPDGGLWASPVGASWGWQQWCESEQWGDLSTRFETEFCGRVFTIDGLGDAKRMPWRTNAKYSWGLWPDFEAMLAAGVQAIHMTERGQDEMRFCYPYSLYGWDCECVLVMDANCISRPFASP